MAARIIGPRVVEPSLLPGNDPAHWGLPPQVATTPPTAPPSMPVSPTAPPPAPVSPTAPPSMPVSPTALPPAPVSPPVVPPTVVPAQRVSPTDAAAHLRELARLRAEGLITDADYEAKKRHDHDDLGLVRRECPGCHLTNPRSS